jgi:putative phosphoribosyl transferase
MFFDRYMAGKILAKKLTRFKQQNTVIYTLPKGGVPVGYEVAQALGLPLDYMTVQKIGHPTNREIGICAVSESGNIICDDCGTCGLDRDWLFNEILLKEKEAERRRDIYSHGKPSVSAENKVVIIVDDGVSTGITMKSAIESIQDQWPEKIIVATPVIAHEVLQQLRRLADEVVTIVDDRQYLGTIDAYYSDFGEVSDNEVRRLLAKAQRNFVSNQLSSTESPAYFSSHHGE